MKIFVFDTETTGFPMKDGTLDKQPYVVQFAGIMADVRSDGTMEEIKRINYLIKPPIPIPYATSQVHGIYDKDVADKPGMKEYIKEILQCLNDVEMVVAHNIEFDEEIMSNECKRHGRDGYYQPRQRFCTMRGTTDFCKLQGRGFSFKAPKLNELHLKLFGERFSGAHDAIVDVEATLRCFCALVEKKVVRLKETTEMRLF